MNNLISIRTQNFITTIPFGLLNTSATLEDPKYAHEGDDGMDLRACYDSTYDHELTRYIKLYDQFHPDGVSIDTWSDEGMQETEFQNDEGVYETKKFITLHPGARVRIPTGLFIDLPKGTRIHVSPRSGWSIKYGLTVLNSPGKVDQPYHQCVNVILINHGFSSIVIPHGERIAQWSIELSATGCPQKRESMEEYLELLKGESDRGGGFGSSGTK